MGIAAFDASNGPNAEATCYNAGNAQEATNKVRQGAGRNSTLPRGVLTHALSDALGYWCLDGRAPGEPSGVEDADGLEVCEVAAARALGT